MSLKSVRHLKLIPDQPLYKVELLLPPTHSLVLTVLTVSKNFLQHTLPPQNPSFPHPSPTLPIFFADPQVEKHGLNMTVITECMIKPNVFHDFLIL